jgi:hypothetical protein
MNARRRRLLNKRIKPRTYTFSFWFKRPGEEWQREVETHSSRLPPFNRCVMRYMDNTYYLYPRLEASG